MTLPSAHGALLQLLTAGFGTLRRIRCNAQIRLSEVQRTCHELVGPIVRR
jgi:hypothetical protein